MAIRCIRVLAGVVTLILMSVSAVHADAMQGTIDGEQRTWHILERQGQSSASFSEIGPDAVSFTVQGHRAERFETQGALSINFMLMNGQPMGGAEVAYFPGRRMFPHYNTNDAPGLELDEIVIDGDRARVSGRFRGEFVHVESMTAGEDPDNTIPVDVHFDVTALRQ
ncbi:hypothetical protein [Thioalkalivibrio denitrificans]|nr:hypothetical protein [Thioalkalivibrio denitrificans]